MSELNLPQHRPADMERYTAGYPRPSDRMKLQMRSKRNSTMKTAIILVAFCLVPTAYSFLYPIPSNRNTMQKPQSHHKWVSCYIEQNSQLHSCYALRNTGASTHENSHCPALLSSFSSQIPIASIASTKGTRSGTSLFMTRGEKSTFDTAKSWSRSATVNDIDTNSSSTILEQGRRKSESRLGVRSRVRSVLQKAKKRTGISNNSEERLSNSQPSPQTVIAEAASIGGLGAVVVDDEGNVDVALDYVAPPLNGTDTESSTFRTKSSSDKIKKKKTAPASTYSPPVIKIQPGPEDCLQPSSQTKSGVKKAPISERDAFTGDVSAAFSVPPPPLPFTLPKLTEEQKRQVDAGERLQFQNDMGREGSGFVVVDVKAPPEAVWDCLLDFESYLETIPTVRAVDMKSKNVRVLKHGVPSETRASFSLSKFRLRVAAIHKYTPHPQGDHMVFTLDPSCTNLVLQNVKGVWYTQKNVDGREVSQSFFEEIRILLFFASNVFYFRCCLSYEGNNKSMAIM